MNKPEETFAEEAQRLVDKGRVEVWDVVEDAVYAYVKRDRGTYLTILFTNGHYWCACKWGRIHSYTTDLCAHALAVKLAVEKEGGNA